MYFHQAHEHSELGWNNFKRVVKEIRCKEAGDFFPNEGHVSLASPPFKTNGVFLMVEQTLYNFISSQALELKRRTLERRVKRGDLIAVASININQPFPTSPSSMAAVACPRVHLPWPLSPSHLLMMSLPGSHAKNVPAGQQGPLLEGKAIAPWEDTFLPVQCGVSHNRWNTYPAQCTALIFITLFLSNRNTPPQLITSAIAP